jgi:hypothetical protein
LGDDAAGQPLLIDKKEIAKMQVQEGKIAQSSEGPRKARSIMVAQRIIHLLHVV